MRRTSLITFFLLYGIFTISHGTELQHFEAFIKDIIKTWQFRAPTVLFKDDLPELCMTHQWLLCLSDDGDDSELSNHLGSIHHHRKQDGMIFVGYQGHEKLLQRLAGSGSTILTSNYPVFMPISYQNDIKLRHPIHT